MNKINKFKKNPLTEIIAITLAAGVSAGSVYAAGAPSAGTEIKNLATVSYEDENGNIYTAQSNEAVITVAPQYKATIENDRTLSAAPGQSVYFPHTIVNTGNIVDVYDLTVDQNAKIYLDSNGNGQPDPGEPEITHVTLAAGETANIVVAYAVPVTASDADTTTLTLTATSQHGGTVDDLAQNNGADGADGTSTDVVKVTTGPVLVLNKESVFNEDDNTITYTLTVKNTGGSDAVNVDIIDELPKVDTDGDGTLDTQVTLVAGSLQTNGLLDGGDTVAEMTDETSLGVDVDADGTIDTSKVIYAKDAVISPNTTVSVSYTVNYELNWKAGAGIDNTFSAFEDTSTNGSHSPADPTNPPISNTTHDEIPQVYAVDADDNDGQNPSPGVNDGGDDDETDNDTQLVDKVASGDTVVFTHVVTNKGNGDDIFNINVENSANRGFPEGTVFTYWNADGTVQLTDSDGDGKPDTGVLGQGEELTIVVKADLPSGATSAQGTNHTATLTAVSSGASSASDSTELVLGEITPPAVDLAAVGATQADDGFNDGGQANAHDEGPVLLKEAAIGETVSFPMTVANESGSPDSFLLGFDNLPEGWTVAFKDANGNTITSTPFLPAGGTFEYTAEVTVSSDPIQALGNSDRNTDTDGYDATDDAINTAATMAGTDGDKDYVITFNVASSVDATRSDSITHAVDVMDSKAVTITPDGQNQVQPGGTVDYPHKLGNDGNVDEAIEINTDNTGTGWSTSTLIDTDGDGKGDTELANLKAGNPVKVYNPDGSTTVINVTDTDGDGNVEFPLEPGQYVKLTNKVFAPADAPQGDVDTTTIEATDTDGTKRHSAQDTSNVILGQVRLDKKVALDVGCDNVADGVFAAIQNAKVAPGECAIWEIVAKNEGDALVKNVVVTDSIPAYTTYLAGSLRVNGATLTDAQGDDEGEINNLNKISFYIGTDPVPASSMGGELKSGESATVRFTVKVDE